MDGFVSLVLLLGWIPIAWQGAKEMIEKRSQSLDGSAPTWLVLSIPRRIERRYNVRNFSRFQIHHTQASN